MMSPAMRWTTFVMFVAVLLTAAYLVWTNNSAVPSLSPHPPVLSIIARDR